MSEMAEQMLKTGIKIEVYETSRTGGNLIQIDQNQLSQWIDNDQDCHAQVHVYPDRHRQTITGFGGSFTDATSYLVYQLSQSQRQVIIQAYFGAEGAHYSLTRTHMNSCDFARIQYSYAPVAGG